MNLEGFLVMHQFLIHQVKFKPIWALLRYFGYNNQLKLADDFLWPPAFQRELGNLWNGQRTELSHEGVHFFAVCFDQFANENHQLTEAGARALYQTAPTDPFVRSINSMAVDDDSDEDNHIENLLSHVQSLEGSLYPMSKDTFLFLWRVCTLFHCRTTLRYIRLLGYLGKLEDTIHIFHQDQLLSTQGAPRQFFYLLVLSTTPHQESLLNMYERYNFLGTATATISDQSRYLCVSRLYMMAMSRVLSVRALCPRYKK